MKRSALCMRRASAAGISRRAGGWAFTGTTGPDSRPHHPRIKPDRRKRTRPVRRDAAGDEAIGMTGSSDSVFHTGEIDIINEECNLLVGILVLSGHEAERDHHPAEIRNGRVDRQLVAL